MKVAIVHFWLIGMRGGEKVLETMCTLFPDADIYTHVLDRDAISPIIARHRISTTFINRLPFARKHYQKYLPLMPLALEALDLTEYDLILSLESGPSKGVIPGPNAVHITYCFSPMRYLWDQYYLYRARAGWLSRKVMPLMIHWLRVWDVTSAARTDLFLADSAYVVKRINKYYRREGRVVYPAIAVEEFAPAPAADIGDAYLWCGELVQYKRPDIAIDAFNASGRPLIVIGDGEERAALEQRAGPNIRFLGRAPFAVLKAEMARCRALVFPGTEDFGIVPLEVQASGRPVLAHASGGALETVIDGETGILFTEQSAEGLNTAIDRFEASDLAATCAVPCRANAERFDFANFRQGMADALGEFGLKLPDLSAAAGDSRPA